MFEAAVRRTFDVVMALVALIVLAPLLAGVALVVRFSSPGPVLFRQMRIGRDNKLFTIFKFRSFYFDRCDASGVQQTRNGDARLTPLGRFLRQTNVDELPQLLNILRGDMSFVGPRPHVPGMHGGGRLYEDLVPYYPLRHAVRPGLTGWAQVNGFRGPTDDPVKARARVDHDLAYIQNRTLWLDLVIFVKTAWRELFGGTGL